MPQPFFSSRELTRATLSVGAIGALIVSTAWIVRPFVSAFLWATMMVISTWPLLLRLQARLRGKRGMAVLVMTVALLLILLVPLGFSMAALVGNSDRIVGWVNSLDKVVLPPPPAWLSGIPLAGDKIVTAWTRLAAQGPEGFAAQAAPYIRLFIQWLIAQIGGAGGMILQFLMTVIMCAVLYTNGEVAARGVRKFATRLAGSNGDRAALLAAGAIRGVAMGIVVTAFVQVLIAAAGLLIASTPGALLLSAVILFLCLAQLGPAPVMIPAVIWEFHTGIHSLGMYSPGLRARVYDDRPGHAPRPDPEGRRPAAAIDFYRRHRRHDRHGDHGHFPGPGDSRGCVRPAGGLG